MEYIFFAFSILAPFEKFEIFKNQPIFFLKTKQLKLHLLISTKILKDLSARKYLKIFITSLEMQLYIYF